LRDQPLLLGPDARELGCYVGCEGRRRSIERRDIARGAPPGTREHADDLVADLLRVGIEVEQDARRDALALAR